MNWYNKYKKLNRILFTWENSGRRDGTGPPFYCVRDKDFNTVDIKGICGIDQVYKVVGYTETPPFSPCGYPSIGIMFEDLQTFEKVWWHYRAN